MLTNKFTNTAGAAVVALTGIFANGAEARDRHHHNNAFVNGLIDGAIGGLLGGGFIPAPQPRYDYDAGANYYGGDCNVPKYQFNNQGKRVPAGTYNPCRGETPDNGGYAPSRRAAPSMQSCVVTEGGRQFVVPCPRY